MNTSEFHPSLAKIYQETADIAQENGWKFNLLYTHPKAYTPFADLFFLGHNPRGSDDADSATIAASGGRTVDDDKQPLFSAYLDEVWKDYGKPKGGSTLQRNLQKIASLLLPGRGAELLRKTPSSNIIPFHSSGVSMITPEQASHGKKIGLSLLDFCKPKVMFCYGFDKHDSPWAYLQQRCRRSCSTVEVRSITASGRELTSIKYARMALWEEHETLVVATKHLSYSVAKYVVDEILGIQPLIARCAGWSDATPFLWPDDQRYQWLHSIKSRGDFSNALREATVAGAYAPAKAVLVETDWLLADAYRRDKFRGRLQEAARRSWGKSYQR